jgi:electron transport complex protein RnfG
MRRFVVLLTIFSCVFVFSQNKGKKQPPVFTEVSNKEVVQSVFPEAVKVDKVNDYWYKVVDSKNKVLGYAMSSMPYCKEIIGYNNTTPVMIITDTKCVIKKVVLLSHWETLGYVRKLGNKGFFNLWDEKTLKEAAKVQLDAYTGATMTAKAVMKNVSFLLENGTSKRPKRI